MGDGGKSAKGTAEGPTRHYHGHRERLRQRVLEGDGSALRDYELLELLLCAFIPRVDTKPIAKDLIARFGTVSAALGASPERLMEVKGIGETAAAYIRAANLLMQQAAHDEIVDRPVISNWAALINYVSLKIKHEKSEQARVLYLDRKNKLIADEKVGQARSIMRPSIHARSPAVRWSSQPPRSSSCTTTRQAIPRHRAPT
jgi:DNA repair protein RadC